MWETEKSLLAFERTTHSSGQKALKFRESKLNKLRVAYRNISNSCSEEWESITSSTRVCRHTYLQDLHQGLIKLPGLHTFRLSKSCLTQLVLLAAELQRMLPTFLVAPTWEHTILPAICLSHFLFTSSLFKFILVHIYGSCKDLNAQMQNKLQNLMKPSKHICPSSSSCQYLQRIQYRT